MLKKWDKIGLREFLLENPGMKIMKETDTCLTLTGKYNLIAIKSGQHYINDFYDLKIEVPHNFPYEIPTVIETAGRIPRDGDHHINWYNIGKDNLCLGSRIRILSEIAKEPTIKGFIKNCVDPFLYSISIEKFVFGELTHGYEGILEDYKNIFNVKTNEQVLKILNLICTKKRLANKKICPCGCGERLGKCKLHILINKIRKNSIKKSNLFELQQLTLFTRGATPQE